MTGWTGRTGAAIAAAVRAGDVTAQDVVRDHLNRIARIDRELGAFVRVRDEAALKEAAAVDARVDRAALPLAGVPIAIKDNIPVAGEPMRVGSAATPDGPQDKDHPVVARLRAAGAVVVGMTNLPEMGIFPFTDTVYGITRNPWDRMRTSGGSSGGAATAVSAGMVPIAHGSDGAGSIRIPAAACGVFGIKPGPDVVPAELGTTNWYGMAENGPLTTTVADAALMLSVMAGDPSLATVTEPGVLRVAVSVKAPSPLVTVHREIKRAVRNLGPLLNRLGHSAHHANPRYPMWSGPVTLARWFACSVPDLEPYAADPSSRLERRTRRHLAAGRLVAKVRPPREDDRDRLRAALEPFFNQHDVLVMPTLARQCPPALRRGEQSWLRSVFKAVRFAPMTGVWNLAGYPAATVPVGVGQSWLPLSVQLVAPPGKESLLLALAGQLEQFHPWHRHAPAYDPHT